MSARAGRGPTAGTALRVACGGVLAALALGACGPGGPPVPEGAEELTFTAVGTAIESNPEWDETWAIATVDDAELREIWADADLRSGLGADDLAPPAGSVAVVLSAEPQYHATEVVRVLTVDDGWLVQVRGYDKGECTLPTVVEADVHVLHVEADEPPAHVAQEFVLLPGCGSE